MPHVQLRSTSPGTAQILVDGIDITEHVKLDGVAIATSGEGLGMFRVTLDLVSTTTLDVDLPECVVAAVRDQAVTA